MSLTRRSFLTGSAAAVGLVLTGPSAPARAAGAAVSRPLLTGPFPRTFVFRQCEVLAQLRPYATWAPLFAPFGAILGKAVPEERTDTVTARNLTYFNRFKHDHPDKLVLLHYNGRGRLPGYRTDGWYAGDWLHAAGATVRGAVDPADTVLTVDDASAFSAPTDPYGTVGADLVLTARDGSGRPDWSSAEQLVVTAVDHGRNTLTVQRACYGTQPLTLPAGAYVAPHVTMGPWSAQDGRLWAYNFATNAPRGADGRSAAQRICAEMTADFAAGGKLARFDGLELDIFTIPVGGADRSGLDGDGDGVADGCFAAGTDTYLAGQADYLDRLRTALGSSRILATDGAAGQRPDTAVTNGIEEEGFAAQDGSFGSWSTYLGALTQWALIGHQPRLSYPLVKTGTGVGDPPDFAGVRVSIGAALLAGTQVSFWDEPAGTSLDGLRRPPDSGHFVDRFSVWDELVGAGAGDPGWLGMPRAGAVWTALARPDLLGGSGTALPRSWVAALQVTGASVTRVAGPALRLDPTTAAGFTLAFVVHDFAGGDLVVAARLSTTAAPGLPAGVPRLVTSTIRSGTGRAGSTSYTTTAKSSCRVYARDLPAGDVTVQFAFPAGSSATVGAVTAHAGADAGYRLFDGGAVFVNPSLHPASFDLSTLGSFVRLAATAGQDAAVNDGTPVGDALTLPPTDALIVRRTS